MAPPDSPAAGLRRNGRLQACEPCRKGKLACGHEVPTCARCARRNMAARCIYHPAPMTKSRLSVDDGNLQAARNASDKNSKLHPQHPDYDQQVNPDQASPTSSYRSHGTSPIDTIPSIRGVPDHFYRENDTVFQRSPRYYGSTSFLAPFNENANLSEDLNIGDDGRQNPATRTFGQPLLGADRPSAPSNRMNQAVKAIWNIPAKEICERLLQTYEGYHHIALNEFMIRHCVKTLFETFEPQLAEPRSPEKLAIIANCLFRNEETPLQPAPEDGMAWLSGFMGPNLRFEMLGLLFCFFGSAYQALQDWDELFKVPENYGRDRKQTSWRMKECADVCLKMCEISEENNEISIALMFCDAMLEASCTGEEGFIQRRRFGEVVVSTVAAGLHRLPAYGYHQVTAASEYKKRLFGVIYDADKAHASFHGTPAALCARFCAINIPLDLAEDELFLPREDLAKVIATLDSRGWSAGGKFRLATFNRGTLELSQVREEILELALSINPDISAERLENLYRRCREVYDNFPPHLHYAPHKPDATPVEIAGQAYLMLNVLQNRFLLHRVAIGRGLQHDQGLLDTAIEQMDLVIMFWVRRDQLMTFTATFDWIIVAYGIPSAGVICVELLKQSRGQSVLQFARSDAIQKLTMFIGFLEWIRPTDGNYKLAGRLQKVVRKIVDRVLDPPAQPPLQDGLIDIPIDPSLAPFGEMDWLNTMDWTQGSWYMDNEQYNDQLQL